MKLEEFFNKLKIGYPNDAKIEGTEKDIELFGIKNAEELFELYLKKDVILLVDIFEKVMKVSIEELDINPQYCVSLPGYTRQFGLKYTDIRIQILQDKDLILALRIILEVVEAALWVIAI